MDITTMRWLTNAIVAVILVVLVGGFFWLIDWLGGWAWISQHWRQDQMKKRDTKNGLGRTLFAIFCWIAVFAEMVVLKHMLMPSVGEADPPYPWLPLSLEIFAWLIVVGLTFPRFLVFVPAVTGLAVLNIFSGKLHSVKSGLHAKFPWEEVRKENFRSLKSVDLDKVTETYAAQDGPEMQVTYSCQYAPDPDLFESYITVDPAVIERGIRGLLSGILSSIIGSDDAEGVRKKVDDIRQKLWKKLREAQFGDDSIEKRYGITLLIAPIHDIDFPEDYEKSRTAKLRAEKLVDTLKVIEGDHAISRERAARIYFVNEGKAAQDQKVFTVEGLEGLGTAAETFAKTLERVFSKPEGGK